MSHRQQSKRAAFAAQQQQVRAVSRISRANRNKPGFIGVCTGLVINNKPRLGMGAVFLRGLDEVRGAQ